MGKGTPSFGKHNKAASHVRCRRCGKNAYHKRKKYCAACGFGRQKKLRRYNWSNHVHASNGIKAWRR